jgi:sporulation protein YlmC with PRC-barrel domain
MKTNPARGTTRRTAVYGCLVVSLAAGAPAGLLAAPAAEPTVPAAPGKAAPDCLAELRTFDSLMRKDGYWYHDAGNGYGFPVYGYGYSYGYADAGTPPDAAIGNPPASEYWRARPGYEVRTLLTSANILAHSNQQPACHALLVATRAIYAGYVADLRRGALPRPDVATRRKEEISAAQPVDAESRTFRSDQLIGTDVVNPQNQDLGSVEDLVLAPATGKITYLVLRRGGLFGIDSKYVPVPWQDFKATPGTNLLVLDSGLKHMDAAPQVKEDQFSKQGEFTSESQKIDEYWKPAVTK